MSQHKNPNRKPRTYFILATKWATKRLRPFRLTTADRTGDKPPTHKMQYDVVLSWTPIGTNEVTLKRGVRRGIPYFYNTLEEAEQALKEIVEVKAIPRRLLFVALEVRHVPNKIKAYKQAWYNDYVVTEYNLKVVDLNKGKDVFDDKGE